MNSHGLFFMPLLLTLALAATAAEGSPLIAAFEKAGSRDAAAVAGEVFSLFVAPVPLAGATRIPTEQLISLPVAAEVTQSVNWGLDFQCYPPDLALLNVTDFSTSEKVRGKLLWPLGELEFQGQKRCAFRRLPNEKGECPEGGRPSLRVCTNGSTIIIDFKNVVDAAGARVDAKPVIEMIQQALLRSAN